MDFQNVMVYVHTSLCVLDRQNVHSGKDLEKCSFAEMLFALNIMFKEIVMFGKSLTVMHVVFSISANFTVDLMYLTFNIYRVSSLFFSLLHLQSDIGYMFICYKTAVFALSAITSCLTMVVTITWFALSLRSLLSGPDYSNVVFSSSYRSLNAFIIFFLDCIFHSTSSLVLLHRQLHNIFASTTCFVP